MRNFLPFTFVIILIISGCTRNEEDSFQVIESPIVSIVAPNQAIVGDNVSIQVRFTGNNGCYTPYSIEADKVGQTIVLRAFSKKTDNAVCTQQVVNLSLNFSFFADLPGPYFFVSNTDDSLSDTLTVI